MVPNVFLIQQFTKFSINSLYIRVYYHYRFIYHPLSYPLFPEIILLHRSNRISVCLSECTNNSCYPLDQYGSPLQWRFIKTLFGVKFLHPPERNRPKQKELAKGRFYAKLVKKLLVELKNKIILKLSKRK